MISSRRRNVFAFTRLLALAAIAAVPATLSMTAESASAQSLAAEFLPAAALPAADAATDHATLRLAVDEAAADLPANDDTGFAAADTDAAPAVSGDALTCMAKVVHHEARNQPRQGQLAVAQLIMARLASGRFADSVCAVVNQHGQFFETASYNPDRAGEAWATAIEVSREALRGAAAAVAPGALFYHAAYQAPTGFFRTRQRIAALGDHVFYR